jgi:hypothetical protein
MTSSRGFQPLQIEQEEEAAPMRLDDVEYENTDDNDFDNNNNNSECNGKNGRPADPSSESDDEYSQSDDGLMPGGLYMLLVPFLLLAVALGIAYIGRREDLFSSSLSSSNNNLQQQEQDDDENNPAVLPRQYLNYTTPSGATYWLSDLALQQIQNYRNGTQALVVNIEIANQAGHAVCHSLAATTIPNNGTTTTTSDNNNYNNDCDSNYHKVQKQRKPHVPAGYPDYYHNVISWRFSSHTTTTILNNNINDNRGKNTKMKPMIHALRDTNWEDPHLLSIFVVRDPLARMLAYDASAAATWPDVFQEPADGAATDDEWWSFAKAPYTDNFALQIVAGTGCCQGARTNRHYLEVAQALLNRFTIVLDMACLDTGLQALADLLGLPQQQQSSSLGPPKVHESPRERIPNQRLYEYLQRKNQLDIELYAWAAATRSLVRCSPPES